MVGRVYYPGLLGISDALVRLAVSIENAHSLIADLRQSLDHVFGQG